MEYCFQTQSGFHGITQITLILIQAKKQKGSKEGEAKITLLHPDSKYHILMSVSSHHSGVNRAMVLLLNNILRHNHADTAYSKVTIQIIHQKEKQKYTHHKEMNRN